MTIPGLHPGYGLSSWQSAKVSWALRADPINVKRIIANITAPDPALVDHFYRDILGLDHGWIRTYAGRERIRSASLARAAPLRCLICPSR